MALPIPRDPPVTRAFLPCKVRQGASKRSDGRVSRSTNIAHSLFLLMVVGDSLRSAETSTCLCPTIRHHQEFARYSSIHLFVAFWNSRSCDSDASFMASNILRVSAVQRSWNSSGSFEEKTCIVSSRDSMPARYCSSRVSRYLCITSVKVLVQSI